MSAPTDGKPEHYITTTLLGSGHAAVLLWWNPDGFREPWQTGTGRYRTKAEAEIEANEWAEAEGLQFVPG